MADAEDTLRTTRQVAVVALDLLIEWFAHIAGKKSRFGGMEMQNTLMKFDPATGEERPYPSHAAQWRSWHGIKTTPNLCRLCGHSICAHDRQYGCAADGCDCETPNA